MEESVRNKSVIVRISSDREVYCEVSLICRTFRCKYETRHLVAVLDRGGEWHPWKCVPGPVTLWQAKIARILETRAKGSYLDYGGKERDGGRVGWGTKGRGCRGE